MRTSTPKPKPVKRKLRKSIKKRPAKVPRHALERLPDDYIVVRGSGARGGVAAARRPRVSVAPTDLGPPPVPPVSRLDRFGRPANTGIPGLPTASEFTRIIGSGFTEAGRALNALGRAFYNHGANQFPPSAPASTVGDETGYETVQEDIESDVEFFDAEGPPLSPPPPSAPAEPSAPPAPDVPVPGTNRSDMEDIVNIRLEIERAENELARSRTAAQLHRLQTRIMDLEQQLEDAREVPNPERAAASTQTPADGEVEALQAQIGDLQDDVLRAMRTVAVAYPEPIARPETRDTETEMEPIRDQTDRIRDLEEYIRQLSGNLMASRDRERELEYELEARPTAARVQELTQLLANEQDYANEVRRDLQQTRTQLYNTQEDLQNSTRMLEHANLTYEQTLQEVERLQALQDQATRRPETISTGVGPDTAQLTEAGVGTETPETITTMAGTDDQLARRRRVGRPGLGNQNSPDMRLSRTDREDGGVTRPRHGGSEPVNFSGRGVRRQLFPPENEADPSNRMRTIDSAPTNFGEHGTTRTFDNMNAPADTDNLAMDVATAGAVARQEEFVAVVPEIVPEGPAEPAAGRGRGRGRGRGAPPAQHNHAPAAPAGRGRARVPVGERHRNAALNPRATRSREHRNIPAKYRDGSA